MVVDVSVIHEFHGNFMQDVSRNGILCHPDPTSSALFDRLSTTLYELSTATHIVSAQE